MITNKAFTHTIIYNSLRINQIRRNTTLKLFFTILSNNLFIPQFQIKIFYYHFIFKSIDLMILVYKLLAFNNFIFFA